MQSILHLIGTFCIVNKPQNVEEISYKVDLIGTFCIVNPSHPLSLSRKVWI